MCALGKHQYLKLYIYIVPSSGYASLKVLYMQLVTSQLRHHQLCHSFVRGNHLLPSQLPEEHKATRLPLDAVHLFGMHIIPPLTINAGTHFAYLQGDGGLSKPPSRFSQVLNLGPLTGRSTAPPTVLSRLVFDMVPPSFIAEEHQKDLMLCIIWNQGL